MQDEGQKIIYITKKQHLSCKLCRDIFKTPITLTCGHTFCYYCLYKFMKQQCHQTTTLILNNEPEKQSNECNEKNIPIPLCPTCCSLVLRPIKHYKQNLTLTNLIGKAGYQSQIKFGKLEIDDEFENFNHKLLIKIQNSKIDPLPCCFNQIRFSTCFLQDILEQSQSSYVVIEWEGFQKNIGLAGKILRAQMEYHSSSRGRENCYRAYFNGLFFVQIEKKKTLQINLKSRYYNEPSFYLDNQQLAPLTICKCEQYHSQNILHMEAFDHFLMYYDMLNNMHYLNQIYRMVDSKPFFQRNSPQNMIYCCIRLLKLKPELKKQIIHCFDDRVRIQKINEFLYSMQDYPIEELFHISIPGKYNSTFVFAVIFMLILFHYLQS